MKHCIAGHIDAHHAIDRCLKLDSDYKRHVHVVKSVWVLCSVYKICNARWLL